MHLAQLVELEYLNVRLYQAQSTLLRLQPLLSLEFRQAVVRLAKELPPLVEDADRARHAREVARRDQRLRQLGLRLGDVVAVDEHRGVGWRFKLEKAEFDERISLFNTIRSRAPVEVFRLLGHTTVPGQPGTKQSVIFVIETVADANRVRSVLRPLERPVPRGGVTVPSPEPGPEPLATFLTGLTAAQVGAWLANPTQSPQRSDREAAARLFYPKGRHWDEARHKHYRKEDLAALRDAPPHPLMDVVTPLYEEGHRLESDEHNDRIRTVRRLMMLGTGTMIDVAHDGEPMWVRVREVRAHADGVVVEGSRVLLEDGSAWPVRFVVSGIGPAETIRRRSGLPTGALRRVRQLAS